MMDNYLSAEQPIIDRITALVPGLVGVYHAADLDGVADKKQFAPAVHVLYKGDRVVEGQGGRSTTGERQCVDQFWYVVLAVRNSRQAATGEPVRLDAGPLLTLILRALQGWAPTVEHSPLKRTSGVDAGFSAGYLYIPLLFTTRITV